MAPREGGELCTSDHAAWAHTSSRTIRSSEPNHPEQLLTGVAIAAGVVTLVAWQLIGAPIDFSIVRVVTVLVIACPHALGLAVPLVLAISTTMGASGGLLVRDRRGLEEARNLDVVVFDKTGTRAWRADPLDQLFFSGVPGVRRPGSRLRPSPV